METMNLKDDKRYGEIITAINKAVNEILNPRGRTKGTATYYYQGHVGNKSVCFTRAKTYYNNRFGFWSWIQTKYKNGMIKRTKFALSGSKKKAEERAEKLLKQLETKDGGEK